MSLVRLIEPNQTMVVVAVRYPTVDSCRLPGGPPIWGAPVSWPCGGGWPSPDGVFSLGSSSQARPATPTGRCADDTVATVNQGSGVPLLGVIW